MKFLPSLPNLTSRISLAALASTALFGMPMLLTPAPAAAQQCRAAGGGPPCETGTGVASLGDPDGIDVTVGNPIHPITGNKYQEEVDAPPIPGLFGLEIRRHFNSSYVSADGPWGKGWSMSYDTRVHRSGTTVQIIQADGRRLIFGLPPGSVQGGDATAAACSPARPGQGELFVEKHGYRWVWAQQRELRFDHQGSLIQVGPLGATRAESLVIERAADSRITRVTDPAGRTMRFDYDAQGYLSRIDHPLGQWHYRINAGGRVGSVTAPDGVVRGYRYEDPGHPSRFTAITVGSFRTIATTGIPDKVIGQWWYDAQGRADRYRRGDGSELRLAYEQASAEPARTSAQSTQAQRSQPSAPAAVAETTSVLTNATGGRTEYRAVELGGKWRITEIRGPGCDECGPTNLRMRYDVQGQLVARAKIGAGGVAYLRDRFDRVVRVVELDRWDESSGDNRRAPATAKWLPGTPRVGAEVLESKSYLQRFEYPDDRTRLPGLIARPSVVPGKEHQVIVDRDDRGNVTRLVQRGYAPVGFLQADSGPLPILRMWHLRYREVAGRRVLVEVDGPLPNGPAGDPSDSDVTQLSYDDEGRHLTATHMPGGSIRRAASHDAAGRPLVVATSDGIREMEERLVYNLQGQVLQSDTSARFMPGRGNTSPDAVQRTSFRFDLQGRLVQTVDSAGRVMRHKHDAVGRPVGVGDERGYRSELTRDAEGRVLVAGLHRPGVDEPLRAAYYGRGEDGRLQSLLLADGRRYRFHYDTLGQAVGFTDAGGLLRLMMPPGEAPAAGSAVVDDFGQVLRQALPDHGVRTMRYDEAGRVVEMNDAAGAQTRYRFDAAGRLLARATTPGSEDVTYTFEGLLLTGVDDPAQVIRHRRDARGRVIETSSALRGLAAPPLKLTTGYDPGTGLIAAQGLAGGESLQIRRTGADEGAVPRQLHLRNAFWSGVVERLRLWLPENLVREVVDLLPRTTVARAIEVHPFDGLSGFIHHNGIAEKRRFDPVGRTSRLSSAGVGEAINHWRYAYGDGSRIASIEHLKGTGRSGAAGNYTQRFGYRGGALMTETAVTGTIAGTPMEYPSKANQVMEKAIHFDTAGRVVADRGFRYAYSALGQLQTVHDLKDDRQVASYAYNYRGQRVRKVVYGEHGKPATTRYFLWNDSRVVAEIEPDGKVVAQYLSLGDGRRDLPLAILRPAPGAATGASPELMALHSDHRGAPVAMSNAQQSVVWRANVSPSGVADVLELRQGEELNLRLPGQYRDAETGLHDNWHRTYDPSSGRYLQPDPLGYPDGPDAYAYAGGDPLNRTDPYGLYEIDVHYYMTFFLGVTAGLDAQEARIVALAAQYVDDNPMTRPVDSTHLGTAAGSIFRNQQRLLGYHFVLSGTDGRTLADYRNSQLTHADSPQLRNLLNAARTTGIGRNARLQFLGEYLHALADTYSHRDAADFPYDALLASCGIGHGHALHEPDRTYDDVPAWPGIVDEGQPPARQAWRREARTLQMESSLHTVLLTFGEPGKAKRFEEIEAVLREFNAIREHDQGSAGDFSGKIDLLQKQLASLGYGHLELQSIAQFRYDVEQAASNRRRFLTGPSGEVLTEDGYPGVCLQGGSRCNAN
jgi:RHS repeat-associated protein